jgi:hypothetical protein
MKKIPFLVFMIFAFPVFAFAANTPPVIVLTGSPTITIDFADIGEPFVDPGFKVNDLESPASKLRFSTITSGVNTTTPGTYTMTYRVTDQGGLFAEATRTIIVPGPETSPEINVSISAGNPPAQVANVDDIDDTTDFEILEFNIQATEGAVVIDEIPINLIVGGATDVDAVVNTAKLSVVGGSVFSEVVASATSSQVIIFDGLNTTILEGETKTFILTVDFNDIEAGLFDEGDTIKAEISYDNVDLIDAVDMEGDIITSPDKTGSAFGNIMTSYSSGIIATFVTASESVTVGTGANDDVVTFDLSFNVEAFDEDIFIPDVASSNSSGFIEFSVEKDGVELTDYQYYSSVFASVVNNDDDELSAGGNFLINEAETEEINLTVTVWNSPDLGAGLYSLKLQDVPWNSTDSAVFYNDYLTSLEEFLTGSIFMN